jgi:hypothetical protein
MHKKITLFYCIFIIFLSFRFENVYAEERVVLESISSDLWYERIYLIAERITGMDYKNFTVQIGDMGSLTYNFPNWYHGKYDAALYNEDINGDKLKDIIIVLNNEISTIEKPYKDIHILNKILDPYRRYEEALVEPVHITSSKHIKIKGHGNSITIFIDKEKYNIDISKYNYENPRDPFAHITGIEYSIKNGKLYGTFGAYVVEDSAADGGLFGYFNIEYNWDGKMYKAKSVKFNELN